MEVSIRFAGIGNKHGNLMSTSDQDGLIPPLNELETSHYAAQSYFGWQYVKLLNARLVN
jgi:hypothetical protein